jgi:hypothetical protein
MHGSSRFYSSLGGASNALHARFFALSQLPRRCKQRPSMRRSSRFYSPGVSSGGELPRRCKQCPSMRISSGFYSPGGELLTARKAQRHESDTRRFNDHARQAHGLTPGMAIHQDREPICVEQDSSVRTPISRHILHRFESDDPRNSVARPVVREAVANFG